MNKERSKNNSPSRSRSAKRPERAPDRMSGKTVEKKTALPVLREEAASKPERIAKVLARAGLCSRRDAEKWITAGRGEVNGKKLDSPAFSVSSKDRILVDGAPLPMREPTRLWLYNKPKGLVTTNKDPEGRRTIFDEFPADLPRVMTIGRLDINTEGLLLLTNDGGLARVLELPETGWLRRYRVRAHPRDQKMRITQGDLDKLADGVVVDGVIYGAVEATLDQDKGSNLWLTIGLREGKNREVKNILGYLGLDVNRLIRISYGPFQLQEMKDGEVREIRRYVLRDQLGARLIEAAGADFEAPEIRHEKEAATKVVKNKETPRERQKRKERHWSDEDMLSARAGADIKERKKPALNRKKPLPAQTDKRPSLIREGQQKQEKPTPPAGKFKAAGAGTDKRRARSAADGGKPAPHPHKGGKGADRRR